LPESNSPKCESTAPVLPIDSDPLAADFISTAAIHGAPQAV
jgi:hypothetical protein